MKNYDELVKNIQKTMDSGRMNVTWAVNNIMVQTYWEIGRNIVEYEQKGNEKAEYGSRLLKQLSMDLRSRLGKGFSRRNILDMRRFYLVYKKRQTVSAKSQKSQTMSGQFQKFHISEKFQILSDKLSWSYYVELLSLDELERSFYETECIKERWSVRELKRQINSALFERLALSKDKTEVMKLATHGQEISKAEDLVKDPYILEFLDIEEKVSEKGLEKKIIDNIQKFILELGKGFTFVGRQHRISSGNKHYYIDLVFYNRILKCFVLIDLKIGEVTPQDIGQMNFYLNYFEKEENSENETKPIGIILAAGKDNVNVEYALGGITSNLFVSKYKFYLPNKKELEKKVRENLE